MNSIVCSDSGSVSRVTQIVRERDSYKWQTKYMCEEIAKALSLPVQSPADTVESVRQLARLSGILCPKPDSTTDEE